MVKFSSQFYLMIFSCLPNGKTRLKYFLKILNILQVYSEKATKCCEIFTLLLSYVVPVKSKVKISQNFVAFSEYMNFTYTD